jgi:LemA protein
MFTIGGRNMIYWYIGTGLLILIVLYVLITYNSLIKLKNQVKESFATMDTYLKKRWDLIPNIVEVVKGYATYENETLKEIITLRNSNYDNMNMNSKIDSNEQITQSLSKLFVLAEAYPALKASDQFLNLSKELSQIEDEIANSRKYFTAVVRILNNKVESVPSNIIAKIFGIKTMKMFEANVNERESIKVEL